MNAMKYLLLLCMVSFFACDDYLNVDSPSNFDNNYVFNSEEEIFRAVSGIYPPLVNVYSGRWIT